MMMNDDERNFFFGEFLFKGDGVLVLQDRGLRRRLE